MNKKENTQDFSLEDILQEFVDMYRQSIGIRKAHLVTVSEPSERLLQRLRALVKQKMGCDVIIQVEVDPDIIGGFVFDIDEYLMDASIKHQLELIREQFIERNRRII
jgi:F-type H+-transporting ATPase subunit delta